MLTISTRVCRHSLRKIGNVLKLIDDAEVRAL